MYVACMGKYVLMQFPTCRNLSVDVLYKRNTPMSATTREMPLTASIARKTGNFDGSGGAPPTILTLMPNGG